MLREFALNCQPVMCHTPHFWLIREKVIYYITRQIHVTLFIVYLMKRNIMQKKRYTYIIRFNKFLVYLMWK